MFVYVCVECVRLCVYLFVCAYSDLYKRAFVIFKRPHMQ